MNFAKYRVQLSTEKKYSSKYEYKSEYEYPIPGVFTWNLIQLAYWFVKKLCFNILMELQYERPLLKGQRSTLTFWTYL